MLESLRQKIKRQKGGSANSELIFNEPLLRMSYGERMVARIIAKTGEIVGAVAIVVFLTSDIPWLFWLGVLGLLYLGDRLLHYNQADHSLFQTHLGRRTLDLYLTPKAKEAILNVYNRVTLGGGNFFLNLAKELLEEGAVREVMWRLDINEQEFAAKLSEHLKRAASYKESPEKTREKIEALVVAALEGRQSGQAFIDQVDLFAALGKMEDENLRLLFNLFEIDPGQLERAVIFGRLRRRLFGGSGRLFRRFLSRPPRPRHRVMNRAWTARPTPLLDRFSFDLTDLAAAGRIGFLIGHEQELTRLINVLSRPLKPNALLVGEPGVGKETIVEHLAYLIIKDQVPPELFDKRLVSLNLGALVAGADQAELQARINEVFSEIIRAGNIILYLPEIHNLTRTAGPRQLTAANTVLPILAEAPFLTIGTTFPAEFRQIIEPDSFFRGTFEVIRVAELSPEEAEMVLAYRSLLLENEYRVSIAYSAIETAVELAKKYFRQKPLPGSADDLLKEAVAEARNRGLKVLGREEVIRTAEGRVNIPIHRVEKAEAERLLNLESLIHRRLINQEEAVRAVADALREYRSGLARRGGPIGSFLFVGPTGVGKTELAKTLAEIQFGSEEAMIRFDMSEYQTPESLARLIGTADGQVQGVLTAAVREKPYSLILLDEFEKAHPDIWNLFLQVLDDGRLTDALDRVVDFTNTIIIATSNAHSDVIHQSLSKGESMASIAEYLKQILVDVFHPELLNRFSDIIVFRDLSPEELGKVVELQLQELADVLKEGQDVDLVWSPEAVKLLAKRGYEPAYGARPLRRVIRDELREPLSEKIIAGEIKRGGKVRVEAEGEEIVLSSSSE